MTMYARLFRNVLLPAHNAMRGRSYCRYRSLLEESQLWERERLAEFQLQELRKLLQHAYTTTPFYRRRFRLLNIEPGDIRSLEDFRNFPVLRRADLQNSLDDLRSDSCTSASFLHSTGGSSGVPVRFFVSMDSYDWRTAAT